MNITKEQYEELMGKLGNTEHVPCPMCGEGHHREEKPILIGDVLEKMNQSEETFRMITGQVINGDVEKGDVWNTIILWTKCGINKSLQTIANESKWEKNRVCANCGTVQDITHSGCMKCKKFKPTMTLKSKEADAILSYLYKLLIK